MIRAGCWEYSRRWIYIGVDFKESFEPDRIEHPLYDFVVIKQLDMVLKAHVTVSTQSVNR